MGNVYIYSLNSTFSWFKALNPEWGFRLTTSPTRSLPERLTVSALKDLEALNNIRTTERTTLRLKTDTASLLINHGSSCTNFCLIPCRIKEYFC